MTGPTSFRLPQRAKAAWAEKLSFRLNRTSHEGAIRDFFVHVIGTGSRD